jgi:RNA polymerase sigma-70 factor (ECF subfamily)
VIDTVRRAQEGDQGAFRALYEHHVGRVHALSLRLTGDSREAEELTQSVFVRAWEHLDAFRGESAFSTWLHRLTVNESNGRRRSDGRRERRVTTVEEPGEVPTARATEARVPDMDLERAIAELPAGAQAVFVLHDVEGYQHQEISSLTGIAAGTSKAQLHRARKLLREALQR